MSLQIITTKETLAAQIINILSHYFPNVSTGSAMENPTISIDTKYYSSQVSIKITAFNSLQPVQPLKVDAVLFLFQQNQYVQNVRAGVDSWMESLKPESAMVCVHTGELSDDEWKYENEINSCENFISVIYENVNLVAAQLPKWVVSSSLLGQKQEDRQLFSFFQLLETTSWNNASKKSVEQAKKEGALVQEWKEQQNQKKDEMEEGQMSQEALQNEMMEFEALMQQMMEVKAMNTSSNERKQKAEELIRKLTKNLGLMRSGLL